MKNLSKKRQNNQYTTLGIIFTDKIDNKKKINERINSIS